MSLIAGSWYKNFDFYKPTLTYLFEKTFKGEGELPIWLTTASTVLLPKNNDTHVAKNYRPIALLNIMYKLYTSCINSFLSDHLLRNNIITPEQAGGKQGVWGTTEQLLINKSILNDARKHRQNLITVWLDYRKAFDSFPDTWLIQALKLVKVTQKVVNAMETLTNPWYTILTISNRDESMKTEIIKFLKGIFQGDSLSVLLFIISLNPLSFVLKKTKGYFIRDKTDINHTHNFFVDDLKVFAQTFSSIQKQLDIITTFSKDINMNFCEEKCAYMRIEKGKVVDNSNPIVMSNLTIKPILSGDNYCYLGIDENIVYSGTINKT